MSMAEYIICVYIVTFVVVFWVLIDEYRNHGKKDR